METKNTCQDVLFNRLPLPLDTAMLENIASPEVLFKEIDKIHEEKRISHDLIPIDLNFNLPNFLSYLLYRIWHAHKKFADLSEKIEMLLSNSVIDLTLAEKCPERSPKLQIPLGFSYLLHASCGLLKDDKIIVHQAIKNCRDAFSVKKSENIPNPHKKVFDDLMSYHKIITGTSSFKNAAIKYLDVLQIQKKGEIDTIVKACKDAAIYMIISITGEDVAGVVTPDGFGIDFKLLTENSKNYSELFARCVCIMCQELGHFIICLKEVSPLQFANNIPSVSYEIDDVKHTDLECGCLFSLILLGTYQKRIWNDAVAREKLLSPEKWPKEAPIFDRNDLENVEEDTVTYPYNSGIVLLSTNKPHQMFI